MKATQGKKEHLGALFFTLYFNSCIINKYDVYNRIYREK
jgi:hypothetical protein